MNEVGEVASAASAPPGPIAVVVAEPHADDPEADTTLSPEHVDIVGRCRETPSRSPNSPPASTCPSAVVRVLVGDLVAADLVHVNRPVPPAELPDESILRDVINGLRAL
ncbi:hypothetical protein SFUMM280S_01093 [Streptomyces fumanus]